MATIGVPELLFILAPLLISLRLIRLREKEGLAISMILVGAVGAISSYTRYSQLTGFLGQVASTADSSIAPRRYYWLMCSGLSVVVAIVGTVTLVKRTEKH